MSELDKRFSPSYWTKRHPQEKTVDFFIETTKKISNEITKSIPCKLNIPYGEGEREKYDIFGIDLPDDSPILIYIHGGYWQYKEVTKEISSCPARSIYKSGIKTIVLGYTLCPENTVFQITEKIANALKICVGYASELGSRCIGLAGHSAGAQLSICALLKLAKSLRPTQQGLFKCVFILGGILDLTEIIETEYNKLLKLTENDARKLSPMFQHFQEFQQIKFLIFVGKNDCPGIIQQAKNFYDILVKQQLDEQTKLLNFDVLDHYDIIERLDDETFQIVRIIAKTMLE